MTTISSEECFALWAPDGVLWSEWAKPVAFVRADGMMPAEAISDDKIPSLPGVLDPASAMIVDLPGADAVYTGLALVDRGFRPVPLFNGTTGPSPVIDVEPIARALGGGAERLKRRSPAEHAAPAFLLDSRRHDPSTKLAPGAFDNRWVALPQDFPSGALLVNRGVRSVTLIQRDTLLVRTDLAHVLRRWQESGVQLTVVDLASRQTAANVSVPKPSGFRLAWYAAVALLGLRRSNVGGFGSTIPEQTARSGFHG